jgi:hypothetical protein
MGIVWVFARTAAACAAMLAMSALAGSAQAQTPDISGTYWEPNTMPKFSSSMKGTCH